MRAEGYPYFRDKSTKKLHHLPDFSVDNVLDIDFEQLRDLGIKHVLFDLDLTIRKTHAKEIEAEIITYLVELHHRGTIKSLNLATNNVHNMARFSQPLGAQVFQPFTKKGKLVRKPHKAYFEKIISALDADPSEIVMIGDKASVDVLGGNRVGMWTILVSPQGKDLLHDRLLLIRFREKRLLKAARALAEEIQNTK